MAASPRPAARSWARTTRDLSSGTAGTDRWAATPGSPGGASTGAGLGSSTGATTGAGTESDDDDSTIWTWSGRCPSHRDHRRRAGQRPAPRAGRRRGARPHVARADPPGAASRPVRRPAAGGAGRAGPALRRRAAAPVPTALGDIRRGGAGPKPTWRCSTRPGRCSAPPAAVPVTARATAMVDPTTTRPGRTATSWSTRPRTFRRCSGGCSAGAACRRP